MDRIKALIVDDNLVIRKGLVSLLAEEQGIEVVGEVPTGAKAIEWIESSEADVVLMDIHMPGVDGIKATSEIMRIRPETKVLVLTALEDPSVLAQALLAGAKGCLVYNRFVPEELIDAVRAVVSGERVVVSPPVALAVLELNSSSSETERKALKKLASKNPITKREEAVLKLIVAGKSNAEIADILNIKEKTVKNHINNVYSKLRIKNRYEVISLRSQYLE